MNHRTVLQAKKPHIKKKQTTISQNLSLLKKIFISIVKIVRKQKEDYNKICELIIKLVGMVDYVYLMMCFMT